MGQESAEGEVTPLWSLWIPVNASHPGVKYPFWGNLWILRGDHVTSQGWWNVTLFPVIYQKVSPQGHYDWAHQLPIPVSFFRAFTQRSFMCIKNAKYQLNADRVIMLPFCGSAKMAAPPLPETPAHALTSVTSPFYKSHASPRVWAAPSFPGQPGSLSLPLNFALGRETFLVSFLCEWRFS
jgi:hypothetical protein